ncbi:MAG: SDR family oxidoreductase [Alphaproteobacteria bacterium]|nr:SDR family oxidoreductase [Alphaproteobacteria bacterium]MDX5368903.1 SDR family oxidoreductase [Alphaproteobacteria bacterium]MDX5463627.1 SDR family oxidoreductase [Alphaproteobacteria bacterium]
MDTGLAGKTALVTGASKGIGLAAARGLAAEGCNLHLVARSADLLADAAREIGETYGVEVGTHALDLSDSANIDALVARLPRIDVLVNNAGAIPAGNLEQVDEARWRAAWDLKVFGYINMTRRFYARMRGEGGGAIVNVIGLAGQSPDFDYVAGSTGNASLMAFTRAVGSYALEDGIRVVGINPGAVMTDRIVTIMRTRAEREFGDADRWREFMGNQPQQRAARPEEVADLVVFLASDRASFISGTVVTLDGGFSSRNGRLR